MYLLVIILFYDQSLVGVEKMIPSNYSTRLANSRETGKLQGRMKEQQGKIALDLCT